MHEGQQTRRFQDSSTDGVGSAETHSRRLALQTAEGCWRPAASSNISHAHITVWHSSGIVDVYEFILQKKCRTVKKKTKKADAKHMT